MDKPTFEVGSEKRFSEFISNLGSEKVAIISHNDLDGIGSGKIVSEVVNADYLDFVSYEDLTDGLIEKLKKEKIKKLILTDLMFDDINFVKKASKFFDVLWIDHHPFMEDVNSEKIVFLNPGGNNRFCATYLCYYLFSKIENLEYFDWLVACACLSDFTIRENENWMREVFKKYGDKSKIEPMSSEQGTVQNLKRDLEFAIIYFRKSNELKKMAELITKNLIENNSLKKYSNEVKKEVDETVERFDRERKEINGRLLFVFKPNFGVGALVSNIVSLKNPNKTVINVREVDDGYNVSMRRQDQKENMNLLMKKVLEGLENAGGGGHIPAAGGHFMKKDLEKFLERLKKI